LLVLAAGGYWGAQQLLVEEIESPLSFDQTVAAIQSAADDQGWEIPKVYKLCQGLAKHGHSVRPVAILELCKPDYAATLLAHDATRIVSSFMPCRISVYERENGKTVISRMNTSLVSRLFHGEVARVMALATQETQGIIDEVLARRPIAAG
jgi:uncharacterized protein (DUF302 family)